MPFLIHLTLFLKLTNRQLLMSMYDLFESMSMYDLFESMV